MELDSRQMMTLALPAVITYLTWTAVQGQNALLQALSGTQQAVAHHITAVTPGPADLSRNPFAPTAEDGSSVGMEGLLGTLLAGEQQATESEKDKPLKLDGTVLFGSYKVAIINGTRIEQGGTYLGLRMEKVGVDHVRLRGFDGSPIDLYLEIAKSDDKKSGVVSGLQKQTGGSGVDNAKSAKAKKEEEKDVKGGMKSLLGMLGLPKS